MSTVSIIRPNAITMGDVQLVKADLTKFDIAKQVVQEANAALQVHFTIANKEQLDLALILATDANKVLKAIEAKRKELGGPFSDCKKEVDDYAKKLTVDLEANVAKVKASMLAYQREEEKRALQARATQRQAVLVQVGFTFNSEKDTYTLNGVGAMSSNELMNYDDHSFNMIYNGFLVTIEQKNKQAAAEALENKDLIDAFGSEEDKQKVAVQVATPAVVVSPPPVVSAPVVNIKGTTKTWAFVVTDSHLIPKEYLMVNESAIREAVRNGIRMIPGVNIFQKEGIRL